MNNAEGKDEVAFLTGKMFNWVLISVALLSTLTFVGGNWVTAPFDILMRDISMILLGAVIVTYLHQKILKPYFENETKDVVQKALKPSLGAIEDNLVKAMEEIVPSVKLETVKPIEDIRNKVTEASEFMLKGIGVLYGAKISGIVNIFPKRDSKITGESLLGTIEQDLKTETSSIRLMGISLGDYFLDRGALHKTFIDLLTKKRNESINIKALIVHPKCEALRERAKWEAGPEYFYEPAFYDSTTFIETEGSARISRRLCDKYHNILQVKLYTQSPTSFVLLTSRFLYFEPYHYAARGCNVPVFQVQAGCELYEYYKEHFNRIWNVAFPISEYESLGPPIYNNIKEEVQLATASSTS